MTYYVEVRYDSFVEVTREPDHNDEYDNGETCTDHSVYGLRLMKNNTDYSRGEPLLVDFKPEVGKTYHLVYAVYSSNDSFTRNDDYCVAFIEIYSTLEKAKDLCSRLEHTLDKPITITTENGKTYPYAIPWDNFFCPLSYVRVESFVMEKAK